eukprot:gene24543-48707_t
MGRTGSVRPPRRSGAVDEGGADPSHDARGRFGAVLSAIASLPRAAVNMLSTGAIHSDPDTMFSGTMFYNSNIQAPQQGVFMCMFFCAFLFFSISSTTPITAHYFDRDLANADGADLLDSLARRGLGLNVTMAEQAQNMYNSKSVQRDGGAFYVFWETPRTNVITLADQVTDMDTLGGNGTSNEWLT